MAAVGALLGLLVDFAILGSPTAVLVAVPLLLGAAAAAWGWRPLEAVWRVFWWLS